MSEPDEMTDEEGAAQRALVHAIWTCIVDASSMNVVMHGRETNAAIRAYRAAVRAALESQYREDLLAARRWLLVPEEPNVTECLRWLDRVLASH